MQQVSSELSDNIVVVVTAAAARAIGGGSGVEKEGRVTSDRVATAATVAAADTGGVLQQERLGAEKGKRLSTGGEEQLPVRGGRQ